MDIIKEMIDVLSPEEKKDFRLFLQRKKNPDKTQELFKLCVENDRYDREFLLKKLYPKDENIVAYHATRKRLIKQLSEYIFLCQKKEDITSEGQTESFLSIAKFFFDRNAEEPGWNFLKQAEELATKTQSYLLLNSIYSYQIEKSMTGSAPPLSGILKKKKHTSELAMEEDQANTAHQVIRHMLMEAMSTGKEIDMQKIVSRVLKKYEIPDTLSKKPRLMYNILSIMRSTVLATKDFYSFEPYVTKQYLSALKQNVFNQYNHRYKVHLLYMIIHVLYRNKKFKLAETFLEEMNKSLQEYNGSQFLLFYPRYILLKAAILNYTGRNQQAIESLKSFLNNKNFSSDRVNTLNIYLNLSVYLFQQGQYHSSVKIFRNIQHSDVWLSKIVGREWVLKKNLMECISQFELGNNDLVDSKLKSIHKNFKELFERPVYKRVQVFLSFVKKLNDHPEMASTKKFKEEVENSFVFVEAEMEDLQAMAFYAWLKGKMENKKYYTVLMELMK
jgi:tetratricopeptide (TPR) repeat protein